MSRESEEQRRADERELKKIFFTYRQLPPGEQERIDALARRSAEIVCDQNGWLQVDVFAPELLAIARMHGLPPPPSCWFAREKHRRWLEAMRIEHGALVEENWQRRLEGLSGEANDNV